MISGFVEKIVYRNEDNAYSVLEVSSMGEDHVLVGTFPYIEEGSYIEAEGEMKLHPLYGEQMLVTQYEVRQPDDARSIEKYLASGAVKGIGKALAARIVKRFGDDTMRVLEEEPELLARVKGISERMAMEIAAQIEEKRDIRDAMIFLGRYGISMKLALKIYRNYGDSVYTVIRENPYRLADDITGIGFRIADSIARRTGFAADSDYRIRSGILYTLSRAAEQGHMYLPEEKLCAACRDLLGREDLPLAEPMSELQADRRIVIRGDGERRAVYSASAYYVELDTARRLLEIDRVLPVCVITGGPGTGKTTGIRRMIGECEQKGLKYALAAPTGRAAKRMSEATGREASTVHRLLEAEGIPEGEYGAAHFQRDETNPLEADVVIVDEMSMVDIYLMHALLSAIVPGTRLVLVGDTNQLPSVGPGNVLRDIIGSGRFEQTRLTKIWRQDEESDIILNAHRMIRGERIDLEKRSRDFLFIKRNDPDAVIAAMLSLLRDKLPGYVGAGPEEIQILCPMRKGPLGVERLNQILQQFLNPPSIDRNEKTTDSRTWREGDKVMQVKNDYRREWKAVDADGYAFEKGSGVYNGDIGTIRRIDLFAETMTVRFDGDRLAEYAFSDLDELELAYAVTIHKSQGSEYPAVIIPVWQGPQMLMTRNLIYTAVTRAKSCAVMVGLPEYFYRMTDNTEEMERYSGLKERIAELEEGL